MLLGEAFIEVHGNTGPWQRAEAQLHGSVGRLGTAFGAFATIGSSAIEAIGSSIGAFVGGIKDSVLKFAELDDTISKVGVVAGEAFKHIQFNAADRLSEQYGISKTAFLDAASTYTTALKGAGAGQENAVRASVELAELAINNKSMFGGDLQASFDSISSALRGDFNMLEHFGPQINAAAIETKALEMGFKKVGGQIDDGAKKAAFLKLLQEKSTDATKDGGDLERTKDSLNNQIMKLQGGFETIMVALGESIAPVANEIAHTLNAWVPTIAMAAKAFGTWLGGAVLSVWKFTQGYISYTSSMITIMSKIGQALYKLASDTASLAWSIMSPFVDILTYLVGDWGPGVGSVFGDVVTWFSNIVENTAFFSRNFESYLEIVGLKFYEFGMNVWAVMGAIGPNLMNFATWIGDNWLHLINDGLSAVGSLFINFGKNLGNFWTAVWGALETGTFNFEWQPLLDGFEATAGKLPDLIKPALIDMSDEVGKVSEKMAKDEEDFAKKKAKEKKEKEKFNFEDIYKDLGKNGMGDDKAKKVELKITEGGAKLNQTIQDMLMNAQKDKDKDEDKKLAKKNITLQEQMAKDSKESNESLKKIANKPAPGLT